MTLSRPSFVRAWWVTAALCLVARMAQAQEAAPDSSFSRGGNGERRGPLMLELSAGRTKMPGISSGGGPATVAAAIGTGRWLGERMMLGLEARAHGTIDIETTAPSVRFVSGVLAVRRTPGEPVLRLAAGPAWVSNPGGRAVRTIGYAASLEYPIEPDLREASFVVFLRYSGTGTVTALPSRSDPFRTTQITFGLRLEL